jgi:RNA polymerase sigma-70 factor, ECF subfamily
MSPGERIQEELLVLRCQEGEAEALEALLAHWQEPLWRHALRLLGGAGQEEAAWDILQEALLAIVRDIRRLIEPAAFPSWAFRIVSHKCRDWLRQRNRRRKWEGLYGEELQRRQEDGREQEQQAANLKAAIGLLSGPDQALLALRYTEGFSINEIATILELPAGSIKSRLFYARGRLKSLLEDRENG